MEVDICAKFEEILWGSSWKITFTSTEWKDRQPENIIPPATPASVEAYKGLKALMLHVNAS